MFLNFILFMTAVVAPQDSSGEDQVVKSMLEECSKEEMDELDEEQYQKAFRDAWEDHAKQIETIE